MPPIRCRPPRHPPDPVRVLRLITRLNIGGPAIQAITLSDRLTARGFRTLLATAASETAKATWATGCRPMSRQPIAASSSARWRRSTTCARVIAVSRCCAAIVRRSCTPTWPRPALSAGWRRPSTTGRPAAALRRAWCTRTTVTCWTDISARSRRVLHVGRTAAGPAHRRDRRDLAARSKPNCWPTIASDGRGSITSSRSASICPAARHRRRARGEARRGLDIPADAQVVSTVGRLTAIKQHACFSRPRSGSAAAIAGALFLIAGDGELRGTLEATARTLGIERRTRFLGWRRDLATIYARQRVFLLTSRNEGTPVALIESLAVRRAGRQHRRRRRADVIDSDRSGCWRRSATRGARGRRSSRCSPIRRGAPRWASADAAPCSARYTLDRLRRRCRAPVPGAAHLRRYNVPRDRSPHCRGSSCFVAVLHGAVLHLVPAARLAHAVDGSGGLTPARPRPSPHRQVHTVSGQRRGSCPK